MVQNVVTIYGLLFFCWCTFLPPAGLLHRRAFFPLHIRIDPQNPAPDVVRGPAPPASPESWCPHVQTGSSVPNILFPENISYANHAAPEFMYSIRLGRHIRAPDLLAVFETSLSSTSSRTRKNGSSAMVITGESNCVETLSPLCRSFRKITPWIGARI